MAKRATIKDVARRAGVSFKTVARVVNGEKSVQESYRVRVEKALKELNYKVDVAARNLRTRRSYTIGLVYDQPSPGVQNGALMAGQDHGFVMQLQPCSPGKRNLAASLVKSVERSRLAGLILCPPISEKPRLLARLDNCGICFVCIASDTDGAAKRFPHVFVNDYQAAHDITGHLIELGHSRIAFLWGDAAHRSSQERFRGFSDAMHSAGLPVRSRWVMAGEYTFESGQTRASRLYNLKDRPGERSDDAGDAVIEPKVITRPSTAPPAR